jgi:tetratricopeptide (TPR) repeat protein
MMSYINDALRKAQKERDGRYGIFEGFIAPPPGEEARPGKRLARLGLAALLVGAVVVGLLAVRTLDPGFLAVRPPASPPAVAEAPSPPPPAAEAPPPPAVPEPLAEQAAAVSRKAVELQGEALAAQRRGALVRAEALYRQVLQIDPERVEALNNLGVLYLQQKRRERAISLFSKAIVLKKDYVDPYYNLACMYAQAKEIDESLWYLKAALAIDADVEQWAKKDADLKNLVTSDAFKKIREERKN